MKQAPALSTTGRPQRSTSLVSPPISLQRTWPFSFQHREGMAEKSAPSRRTSARRGRFSSPSARRTKRAPRSSRRWGNMVAKAPPHTTGAVLADRAASST